MTVLSVILRNHTKDCVNLLQGIHLLILYDLLLTVLDPVKQIVHRLVEEVLVGVEIHHDAAEVEHDIFIHR